MRRAARARGRARPRYFGRQDRGYWRIPFRPPAGLPARRRGRFPNAPGPRPDQCQRWIPRKSPTPKLREWPPLLTGAATPRHAKKYRTDSLEQPNAVKASALRACGIVDLGGQPCAHDVIRNGSPNVCGEVIRVFEAIALAGNCREGEKDAATAGRRCHEAQHARTIKRVCAGAKFLQVRETIAIRIIIGAAATGAGGTEVANLPGIRQAIAVGIA